MCFWCCFQYISGIFDLFCAIVCKIYLFTCPKVHLSIDMTDLNAARSHSSMNIENLTSIPVGGSITLINYAHRQLPTQYSPAKDRGWAWVVCAGSFFVMFMVYGIHTSFGVLLVVLLDHFNANKASTGKCLIFYCYSEWYWISAIQIIFYGNELRENAANLAANWAPIDKKLLFTVIDAVAKRQVANKKKERSSDPWKSK